MAVPLIISVSGLRGEIGSTLTPEVAMRYAAAFSASVTDPGPFVITRDGRVSGTLFADALAAALTALGRDVLDGGIAATPTTGVLVRDLKAAGGIQISASHNPKPFNGLKLFSAVGRVIPKKEGEKVLDRYRALESGAEQPAYVPVDRLGKRIRIEDTISAHLAAVLKTVDVEKIRSKKFRVFIDSNHGAGSVLGRPLLEALGCEIVLGLGQSPDGAFEHTPEPTAENLAPVLPSVQQAGAAVGFCQDPDADRLALVDENARYIGEEYTLAICAKQKMAKKPGPMAINSATSRMTIDVAESFGVSCRRSPVGEANVVDLMLDQQAVFGGEGNGGPIDPAVGLVRDSFVGMATVLEALASSGKPLSELADELPRYAILKKKVTLPADQIADKLNRLAAKYADYPVDRSDGVRIDLGKRWALVRPSNTEPIVRVIVEAETNEAAEALAAQMEADIQ